MAGGGEVSASAADLATACERRNEEGEMTVVLTEDPEEASASSGKVQRGQNGDGDLRCWRLKTTAIAAMQRVRRRASRRGGVREAVAASACGGAFRCVQASWERATEEELGTRESARGFQGVAWSCERRPGRGGGSQAG